MRRCGFKSHFQPYKITMKIKILNHTYDLSESDPGMWNQNGIGRSNIRTSKIDLLSTASKELKDSTLLHEVVHQICDLLDLSKVADDEAVMSGISVGLYDFIKNNPDVIRGMFEK